VSLLVLPIGLLACTSGDPVEEMRRLNQAGRYEASLEIGRDLLDEGAEDPELFYLYGVALVQTRQITQAVWPLRRAMESEAWYEPAALQIAQLAVWTRDWTLATSTLDELIQRAPDNTQAIVLRAYARVQSRQEYEGGLADADAVLAEDPQNSDALVLRAVALLGLKRIDEAGEAIEAAAAHFDEAGLGLADSSKFCVVRATFAKEKSELETAEEIFEECLEGYPTDFLVVDEAVKFFDARGHRERSLEIIRTAFEGAPDVRSYRLSLVHRLGGIGEHDEAERLMREATQVQQPEAAAAAFSDLARYYFERERLDDAVAAFEEAHRRLTDPAPEFLFAYADVLVAAGRLDAALALTDEMTLVPHRELVRGRIALKRGDPEAALRHFTAGQELWPNNAVSRYFAAQAAEQLGDLDRAIEEYRYSIRTDAGATDARIRLARILTASGDDEAALYAIRHEADTRPGPDPLGNALLELEIRGRIGQTGQLPPRLRAMIRLPEVWPDAVVAIARGMRAARGPAAAVDVVTDAERLDLTLPANAAVLSSLVEDLLELDRPGEAIRRVDAALRAHPRAARFHALRGRVLERLGGEPDEIRAAWERAVALGPEDAFALRGLAALEAASGDVEKAIDLYRRASEADPDDTEALRAMASLLADAGRDAEAERALRDALERDPYDGEASLRLARLMLARGADDDIEVVYQLRRAAYFGHADEANRLLAEVETAARNAATAIP
jgi:tetratricopeptide (TPR) repeat protein